MIMPDLKFQDHIEDVKELIVQVTDRLSEKPPATIPLSEIKSKIETLTSLRMLLRTVCFEMTHDDGPPSETKEFMKESVTEVGNSLDEVINQLKDYLK